VLPSARDSSNATPDDDHRLATTPESTLTETRDTGDNDVLPVGSAAATATPWPPTCCHARLPAAGGVAPRPSAVVGSERSPPVCVNVTVAVTAVTAVTADNATGDSETDDRGAGTREAVAAEVTVTGFPMTGLAGWKTDTAVFAGTAAVAVNG
jgi:hypothetical protein